MSQFDSYVNQKLTSSQFAVGLSTVLLSVVSKDIIPRLPRQALKILDYPVVHVLILAFLITAQTKQPTLSIITAIAFVFLLRFFTKQYAPDVPPLSEILKPTDDNTGKADNKQAPVVCNCSPQIIVPERKPFFN